MNGFQAAIVIGFAAVIFLLYRLEVLVRKHFEAESARIAGRMLEERVRDQMPTLWRDPDARERLVTWFTCANSQDDRQDRHWHWPAIAERLLSTRTPDIESQISAEEVERLSRRSSELVHEAEASGKLTSLEIRYLLHAAWSAHFADPFVVWKDQDVPSFEAALKDVRTKYLASPPRAT